MRGRKPSGPEYVQRLEGSARAKERAEAVLATLGGRISVQEACRRLGVGEAYFNRLRVKFLRGGLPALEDQPAGRRRRPVSAAEEQIGRLETALGEARLALQAAQVREEIALTMPQLLKRPVGPEKKNAPAAVVTTDLAVAATTGTACVTSPEPQPAALAGPGSATSALAGIPAECPCSGVTLTGQAANVEAFTAAHLERLERIAHQGCQKPSCGRPRGMAAQQALRELEQSIRQGVLDFCRQAAAQGLGQAEAADWLKMSPRTVRHWQRAQRAGAWEVRPRGRRLRAAPVEQLQEVVGLLHRLGPATGLAVLQGAFPELARAELHELLHCYRQAWQGEHSRLLYELHWQEPGRVWAMDYAEAPSWIDGCYRYVLAVRDLASGQQLLWLPMHEATAQSTLEQLALLFALYGSPLVLKSDNGSAFSAVDTRKFLQGVGVWPLFSPVRTPAYNGSCEAGIGSMKRRTAYQAERDGHAGHWTSAELETAREQANETARPRGPQGPTPAEIWRGRAAISTAERRCFAETVARLEWQVRQARTLPIDEELRPRQEAAVQREVLRRALVAHGYLLFTRRRIPLPIRAAGAANIR